MGTADRPTIHALERVMGTVVVLDVYLDGPGHYREVVDSVNRARETLQRADAVFTTWRADSPMSRLRRGEITIAQCPPEIATVLAHCEQARDVTRGWFDPWSMPGGVDPTGYVKGWAAQQALEALKSPWTRGAVVNAAGDVASYGRAPSGSVFRIGITDPLTTNRLACVVEVEGAIATSGTYERGEHLIDPRTGVARTRVASASVTGPDLGMADAMATALAVAGRELLDVFEPLEGYEGFVVESDGSCFSSGFPFASDAAPVRGVR